MPRPLNANDDPVVASNSAENAVSGDTVLSDVVSSQAPVPVDACRGNFTVISPVAQGGLGIVSVARDEKLKRNVAIKEIRHERLNDALVRARFIVEAEVTGRLEHPGIVPIYALDEDADGRPYYAMRFIEGKTLAEAIEEHRKSPGTKGLRSLLQRFVSVCQTMAFAHSRDVVHRDLKPSNIMLGEYGETLVVDWGLAKCLNESESTSLVMSPSENRPPPRDDKAPAAETYIADAGEIDTEQLTQHGQVLGTPTYMSPEQAAGASVGPASDNYSLGAVLYSILTGRTPWQGQSVTDILQKLSTERPPLPSKVDASVPKALEAICLKAMSKSIDDRYFDPAALAADIDSWMADEPVSVYREPFHMRAMRWMRGHRTLVASVAALLLTAVVALSIGIFAVGKEQSRTQAALEAEATRRQQTREALDMMSSQVINNLLARQEELTPDTREFLRQMVAQYEEFATDTGNDEASRSGVAMASFNVAAIRTRLGLSEQAMTDYERAAELYASLADEFSEEPDYLIQQAECHLKRGQMFDKMSDTDNAEKQYAIVLSLQDRIREQGADSQRQREQLASIRYSQAVMYRNDERWKDAESAILRAIALQEELVGGEFASRGNRRLLASMLHEAGLIQRYQHNHKDAQEYYTDAIRIVESLVAEAPRDSNIRMRLGVFLNDFGVLLKHDDDLAGANDYFIQALEVRRKAVRDFPGDVDHLACLGATLLNLGNTARLNEEFAESLEWYDQAEASLNSVLDIDTQYSWAHGLRFATLRCRIESQIETGHFDEALRDLDTYSRLYREHEPDGFDYVRTELRRALVFVRMGNLTDGISLAEGTIQGAPDPAAGEAAYFAAAVFAAASVVVEGDALKEEYRQRAVAGLKTALENDYDSCGVRESGVTDDSEFDPIRDLPEFQALLNG